MKTSFITVDIQNALNFTKAQFKKAFTDMIKLRLNKDALTEFVNEIYFFAMENKTVLDKFLCIRDKYIWSF